MSGLIRNSAYLSAGQLLRVALQSALFLGLSRALGATGYGHVAGIMAIATTITPVATLGAQFWVLQEISRSPADARPWFATALRHSLITIPVTVLVAILLCMLILPDSESRSAIWLFVLSEVAWVPLFNVCLNSLIATEAAGTVGVLSALMPAIRLALLFLLILTPNPTTLDSWAPLYFLGSGIAACISLFICMRMLNTPSSMTKKMRPRWVDGILMSTTSASSRACADLDKSLLSAMSLPTSTGIYAASYRIIELILIPVFSLQSALFPTLFREGLTGRVSLTRIARNSLVPLGYAGVVGVALYFLAASITKILGPSFAGAEASIQGLCMLPTVMAIRYFICNSLAGSSHHKANLLAHLAGLVVNVCLNLLLIPALGIKGAIYASYATELTIVSLALPIRARLNNARTSDPPVSQRTANQ